MSVVTYISFLPFYSRIFPFFSLSLFPLTTLCKVLPTLITVVSASIPSGLCHSFKSKSPLANPFFFRFTLKDDCALIARVFNFPRIKLLFGLSANDHYNIHLENKMVSFNTLAVCVSALASVCCARSGHAHMRRGGNLQARAGYNGTETTILLPIGTGVVHPPADYTSTVTQTNIKFVTVTYTLGNGAVKTTVITKVSHCWCGSYIW